MPDRRSAGLDAATLQELAALADRDTRPVPIEPERMAAELAEIAEQGDRPTVGWFRRNLERPSRPALCVPRNPASVARVAFHMVAEGYESRLVAGAVYDAATNAGMSRENAIEATAAGIDRAGKPARAS
jgi:hypothetical protein